MLRITQSDEDTTTTLKLEGRLAGVWVNTCVETLKALVPGLGHRHLRLDIRDVTYVDVKGAELLAQIYRQHKALFLTGSPLTRHFANQAIEAAPRGATKCDRRPDGKHGTFDP